MIDCAKYYELDEFVDHVWNFDYVSELSPTQLRMLKRVHDMIASGPPSDYEYSTESDSEESSGGGSDSSSSPSLGAPNSVFPKKKM